MKDFMANIHTYFRENRYVLVGVIVLFTVLTLALTLLPSEDLTLPSSIISHDKLGHFLLFGGWTFLIGYYWFSTKPKRVNWFLIFIAGVIFGGFVELLQALMPFQRDPTLFDWLADSVGAFCAVSVLYLITRGMNKRG